MTARADGDGERRDRVELLAAWALLLGFCTVVIGGIGLIVGSGSGWIPPLVLDDHRVGGEGRTAGRPGDRATGRPGDRTGNGVWLAGDTLVLSRFDAVTGYDVRRGTERWQYVPPGRSDVCAVSTAADSGIVLLVHGEPGGGSRPVGPGCATVAAVDLSSGRELWHTARVNADRWSRAGHPLSVYRRW